MRLAAEGAHCPGSQDSYMHMQQSGAGSSGGGGRDGAPLRSFYGKRCVARVLHKERPLVAEK